MSGEQGDKAGGDAGVRIATPGVGVPLAVIGWLGGIAAAEGWLVVLAVAVPPYGWYLVVESVMRAAGLLG